MVTPQYRPMRYTFTILALLLVLVGCSSVESDTSATWRASNENGCKPGIGIELTRTTNGFRGFMFLLDPNKPHDFGAGSRHCMEIHDFTEKEIQFAVQWLPTERDEMVLRLTSPLSGRAVSGVLLSADGSSTPLDYEFARTP